MMRGGENNTTLTPFMSFYYYLVVGYRIMNDFNSIGFGIDILTHNIRVVVYIVYVIMPGKNNQC